MIGINYKDGILKRVAFKVNNRRIVLFGAVAEEIIIQWKRNRTENGVDK